MPKKKSRYVKDNSCLRCKEKMRLVTEENRQVVKCFNCGMRIDYRTGKSLPEDKELFRAYRKSLSMGKKIKSAVFLSTLTGALLGGGIAAIIYGYNTGAISNLILIGGIIIFCTGAFTLLVWIKEAMYGTYLELIGSLCIIGLFVGTAIFGSYYIMMPTPNDPLMLTDNTNDFVTVEGETAVNLAVVDITRVEISNDGKNLQIAITTAQSLPTTPPKDPTVYLWMIRVMADDDPNKYASATLIIDEFGWSISSTIGDQFQFGDKSPIKYQKSGKTVTFKVPLSLEEWGKDPQKMSVQVWAGYEFDIDVRIYDLVPNQNWFPSEYIEYELWK